jgi:hypothetical protein
MPEFTDHTAHSPIHDHQWKSAYAAVLLESEIGALFTLVEIAEAAILTRREELAGSDDHHAERQAIEDALSNLAFLKQKRLQFGNETP